MKCYACGDLGWVYAVPFDDPLKEIAFVCAKCSAAEHRRIGIGGDAKGVYWQDSLQEKYFLRESTMCSEQELTELRKKRSETQK